MKNFAKRSFSLVLALVLCLGLISGVQLPEAEAASYTYNWGARGDVADEADFTRSTAEEWYAKYGYTYEELAALSGSSTNSSSVPSSALYQRLRSLMTNAHSNKTSYDGTKSLFTYTDCENGTGIISSFYSGKSLGNSWNGSWNREHTWPNSKGDNNGSGENDIFMLRPTATSENSSRGNDAYGESGSYYHPNSESNGKYDLRGDVVRIMLFVYVRWQSISSGGGVLFGSSGVLENKEVMLKWLEEDPVDTWELGRNDACQSITGTRNVFVDYPELGFLLFGADVPSNYTSPSGAGSAVSYNITASSNNTGYGTVSLSGKTITATPKTGYYVTGYTVLSGSAKVTQSGNTFTVVPSSDCSIRINFAAKTAVKLTFMENGITAKTVNSYGGDTVTLPSNTNAVADGYTFLGWTDSLVTETTTKPTFYTAGASVTASNKTYYALYSRVDGGSSSGNWTRVESTTDLRSGDPYILAHADSGKVAGGLNGKYLDPLTATFSTDKKEITTLPDGVMIFTLGGSTGSWTLTNEDGQALGCTTEKTMLLGTQSKWTITVSGGTATVKTTAGTLQYNTTAPRFTTYSNASQQNLNLYTMGGTVYYTTSTFVCDHEDTTNTAAVAATCTATGYTAGVYCNDCETYISGHEVVAALGHSWGAWVQTTAPTCTATGVETATCTRCSDAKTQTVAAKGHSYTSVVTKPTETTQGYTTYTCSVCGYSYKGNYTEATGQTFYVSFSVPEGVSAVATMACGKNGITLPTAGTLTGYTFLGWTTAPVEKTETKPTVLTGTYTATTNTTLYAVYSHVEGGTGVTEWVKKDITAITSEDVFVITMAKSGTVKALPNNATSIPSAVTVTVSGDKLSAEPATTLLWNLSGDASGYSFSVNGKTGTYLNCTNTSKGVKIDTTKDTFTITSGYLKSANGNRYVGVYNNQDWRCYADTSVNIGGQTLAFYVKTASGTTYYTTMTPEQAPVASVNGVEYTDFIDAYNEAGNQYVTLLADVQLDALSLDADLFVDLNGYALEVEDTTLGGYSITVKDSATDDYTTLGGYTFFLGDNEIVPTPAAGYLVVETDDGYTLNAYSLDITHISLDAANDALGFKAKLSGNALVQSAVTGYGFEMGVDKTKTYEKSGQPVNGEFTLRLKGILKAKGGEKAIQATAFVYFENQELALDQASATMRQALQTVNANWNSFNDSQQAAVKTLYGQYSAVIAPWLGEDNNIM